MKWCIRWFPEMEEKEKFLADESVDFRVVTHLREDGYDLAAVIESDAGINDQQVLEMANRLKAILLTEDKDFGELTYRLQRPNQGIILMRMGGLPLAERLSRIRRLLTEHLEELRDKFTVITRDKIRIKEQQ